MLKLNALASANVRGRKSEKAGFRALRLEMLFPQFSAETRLKCRYFDYDNMAGSARVGLEKEIVRSIDQIFSSTCFKILPQTSSTWRRVRFDLSAVFNYVIGVSPFGINWKLHGQQCARPRSGTICPFA